MTPERATDPQQINLYAYVRNNPLVLVDPTGQIIDDAHLKDNKKYQSWKTAFLATDEGERLWNKYNDNTNFTLKVAWQKGKNGASTSDYKFSDGKLIGATITLGNKMDSRGAASKRDEGQYPLTSALGKENVDKTTMAVGVFAHEFGHVEDANANPARFQLLQAYNDLVSDIRRDFGNAGLVRGIRGEELAQKKDAYLQAFGVGNERDFDIAVDNSAEKAAIPVIQQRYGILNKKIPPSVQNAITKLQGVNK